MTNYITVDVLKKISSRANMQIVSDLAQNLDTEFAKSGINTYLDVCHFLAQAAFESDGFKTLQEYASGHEYEGRKDLGNTHTGDGVRFKGRGIFQLTGRANYANMSSKLGVDLVSHPELAATGKISIQTAIQYWNDRNLNEYAKNDDINTITRKINGGLNGLSNRVTYLKIIKGIIPKDLSYSVQPAHVHNDTCDVISDKPLLVPPIVTPIVVEPPAPPPHDPNNFVVVQKGEKSSYVKDLQSLLIKHGAKITADGDFGNLTEAAINAFQKQKNLEMTGVFDTNTINSLVR